MKKSRMRPWPRSDDDEIEPLALGCLADDPNPVTMLEARNDFSPLASWGLRGAHPGARY